MRVSAPRQTVLVVDDNPAGRYVLCHALAEAGFDVREATTGAEAIRLLADEVPDAILLDVNLPDVDGRELCRQIRGDVRTAHVPVLHVTATLGSTEDRIRGFDSGADAYLTEPIEPAVMIATLRAVLRARRAEQDLAAVRDELATQLADLTRLHDLTNRLAGSIELEQVLNEVLAAVTEIQGTAMGHLMLYDRRENALTSAASRGLDEQYIAVARRAKPGEGPCGRAMLAKRRLIVEDTEADPAAASFREAARLAGYRAVFAVPLLTLRGEPMGGIAAFFPAPHRPADRTVRLVEVYSRHAAQAIENARLYREADEGRRILEALMEHVPEGIAIAEGAQADIRMVSRYGREITGEPGQGSLEEHRAHFRLFHPEVSEPAPAEELPLNRAMRLGEAVTGQEWVLERPDGTRISILCNAGPIRGEEGRITGGVLAWHDITERKMFEQRLNDAQRLESIGLLAGGIAHDFNNLLTSILGGTSLALDFLEASHPAADMLRDVLRSSERAAHLTSQLLAYSGKGRFVVRSMDLSEAVRQGVDLLRNSVPPKVDLVLDLEAGLPSIKADQNQLQQLVLSLVMNACEAVGDKRGTVTLRTGRCRVSEDTDASGFVGEIAPGPYVYLEVQDTGCGIDEKTRSRIFEPFFTTKFVGRGLGLSAALGIAKGHHGAFQVESVPGEGSSFRVLLPALEEARREPAAAKRTVLVVDDEVMVMRVAQASLERSGYAVMTAQSGPQAIELLQARADAISAVVLDLKMPGMSGEDALREIRRLRPDIEVLIATAYDEELALRMVAGMGVAGIIQKPFTPAGLVEKVKQVLR